MKLCSLRALAAPALLTPALMALLTGSLHAQCVTDNYLEAWVDPFYGNNGTGAVGAPANPFQTLSAAIAAVNGGLGAGQQGLVHALPGLYASASNGEAFPIRMEPDVHVQGAGAKETVIRVREFDNTMEVFWPLTVGPFRRQAQVAIDYSNAEGGDAPMLDGFTIQGADVQVYAEAFSHSVHGRISNCVFDMREDGDEQLQGTSFGQLSVSRNSAVTGAPPSYEDVTLLTFNNTFIQGFRYGAGAGAVDVAIPAAVAICDVNDPNSPEGGEDPGPLRGVNDLHIQNNAIRCLDDFPRTAMLGLDFGDTGVVVPAPVRPTNAFDGALIGGVSVDPAMTFTSAIVGVPPTPAVDLGLADPGFLGEFLCFLRGATIRDFRLLPDSVLVDQGVAPVFAGPMACTAPFQAVNGVLWAEPRRQESARGSFDFDGEVQGNPRVVGAAVDIGSDEFDSLVIAGSYGNDTKSHHLPYDPTLGSEIAGVPRVPTGSPDRVHFHAAPTTFAYWLTWQPISLPPGTFQWSNTGFWTHMPGSLAFQDTTLIPGVSLWLNLFWPNFINSGTFNSTATAWVNWESGQNHSFATFTWSVNEITSPTAPSYLNSQCFNAGPTVVSTNLQSEYL